ncbi:MAG: hypothetical protein DWQ08_14910 [Proteobacteria bacterium]|nr:MAG: hypothetical protein DWQ08_14910 [Pseudomonadota bacterium]
MVTPVHTLLRLLGAIVYPIVLAALMHLAYLFMVAPFDAVWVAAKWWGFLLVPVLTTGAAARVVRLRLVDAGSLEAVFDRDARRRLGAAWKWLLVQEGETVKDCAKLCVPTGAAIVVLTDERMLVALFRAWSRRPVRVTESDRFAIKRVSDRTARPRRFADWVIADLCGGSIEVELVGVAAPQHLRFGEPRSRDRFVAAIRAQPDRRPAKNGIRLIQHLPHRRALKRRYVTSLFPRRAAPFLQSVLMSAIFPGFGQIQQGRLRAGLPYAALFVVSIAALVARGVNAGERLGVEVYAAPLLSMISIWLVSILELFMHRNIHPGG